MEVQPKTAKLSKKNLRKDLKELQVELNNRSISKTFILETKSRLLFDTAAYDILMDWALKADPPLNQKSAWLISHISDSDENILSRNFSNLIKELPKASHDGVIRDLLRGITKMPLNKIDHGLLIDACFKWMNEGKKDLAVKYNAMKILERMIKIYPELKTEFKESLQMQIEIDLTTFKIHAKKTLARIK